MNSFLAGNSIVSEKAEIKASDSYSIHEGQEIEGAFCVPIDSDEESTRKRSRAYSIESTASDKKGMRGNYRCSRCNKPKKGHKCNLVTQLRKKYDNLSSNINSRTVDRPVDCPIGIENYDSSKSLILLDLSSQGYPSSYT